MKVSAKNRPGLLPAGTAALAAFLTLGAPLAAQDPAVIRLALGADPTTFDPARYRAGDDSVAYRLMFSALTRRGDDGTITGGLAESWEQTGPTTYVFHLQPDAVCADGTPVDAEVVVNSLRYIEDPETQMIFRGVVFGPDRPEISASDDGRSVTIELPSAYPGLLAGLSMPMAGVICPAGLADLEGLHRGDVPGASSGGYVLTEAVPGVRYSFAMHDNFNGGAEFVRNLPGRSPDAFHYSVATDPSALINQLIAGELDKVNLPANAVERIEGDARFDIASFILATDTLYFNQSPSSPFHDNPDLRRAVLQAIDRAAVTEVSTGGRGTPVNTVLFPNLACGNDDASLFPEFDPAEAGALLNGVEIRISASPSTRVTLEYIQASLMAMGANVTMMTGDNAENWARVLQRPETWDMSITNVINFAGVLDAPFDRLIGTGVEDGGQSITRSGNAEAAALLDQARAAGDLESQCALVTEAEQAALRSYDFMPLHSFERFLGYRQGLFPGVLPGVNDDSTIRILAAN